MNDLSSSSHLRTGYQEGMILTLVELDLFCSVIRKPAVRVERFADAIQTVNLVIDSQSVRDIARIKICIYRLRHPRADCFFLRNQDQVVMLCRKLETV